MPSPAFLRTRVARRILLLFLACAVLPLTILAGLGYHHLAADLGDSIRHGLRAQTKSSGMMLLDRLGALSALLETMAAQLEPDRPLRPGAMASTAGTSGPRFRAVGLVRPGGHTENLIGELPELPAPLPEQEAHLRSGGVALVTGSGRQGVRVFLVRAVDGLSGARLWGLLERSSVYGSDPGSSVAPPGALPCLTSDREVLACLAPETLTSRAHTSNGTFRWKRGSSSYLAASWTLFLNRMYAAPSWTLSLSVPESSVAAPLASLRRLFLLGLGLALALVFTLAHIQLRRSMEPLEALEAGTARVAAGRFDEPVVVRSGDEFQALAESFNRMATELGRQFEHQNALSRVHEAALAAAGPEAVLQAVLAGRAALLPGDAVAVARASHTDPRCWIVTRGGHPGNETEVRPTPAELAELSACTETLFLVRGNRMPGYLSADAGYLVEDCLVLPFRSNGGLAGVVALFGKTETLGRADTAIRARHTVDEIALAVSNARLVLDLEEINWGALTALARTIDAVSPWTAGHSERVTLAAIEIGRRLGLSEDEIDLLHRGGLLHDIGKVGVPVNILDKPLGLTGPEVAQIRQHPVIGARILAPIGPFRRALPLVLHHHELLDGSGYPHGLSGEQIPLLVRVLTVADVFDALVSDRPYRAAWPVEEAIAYLQASVDRKFDRRVVEALHQALATGWRPVTSTPESPATDHPGPLLTLARFRPGSGPVETPEVFIA